MDEHISKLLNGYLMILAWIGSGLPGYHHTKEAHTIKYGMVSILQEYTGTALEGIELAQHASRILRQA